MHSRYKILIIIIKIIDNFKKLLYNKEENKIYGGTNEKY